MALTVQQLQVLISANADQFHSEIQGISTQLKGLQQSTTAASDTVGGSLFPSLLKANLVTDAITSGIGFLRNGLSALGNEIVNTGSQFIRMTTATNTIAANMGVTTAQTNALRTALNNANLYGTQVEITIKDLIQSGLLPMTASLKTVDARTGETVTGIEGLVLTMKDLSAAAGVDSVSGIERLTRFIREGRLEEAEGLIEVGNLNEAYKAYAKTLGVSIQNLTAEEKAQARMNLVVQQGNLVWGTYANTFYTSGKALQNIQDKLGGIRDVLAADLEPILSVVGNAFYQFVGGIFASLNQGQMSVENFANTVAAYLVAVTRIIGKFLEMIPGIGQNFAALANFSVKTAEAQGSLAQQVADTGQALDNTANSAGNLKSQLAGLAGFDQMNVITQPSGASDAAAANLAIGTGTGGDSGVIANALNASAINSMADKIQKQFTDAIKNIQKAFDLLAPAVKLVFGLILADAVIKSALTLGAWVVSAVGTGLAWAGAASTALVGWNIFDADMIGIALTMTINQAKAAVAIGIVWVENAVNAGIAWTAQKVSAIAGFVAMSASAVFNAATSGAAWAANAIKIGLQTAATWIAVGAVNAWTAAQWLWNIAMDANPLGLIVLGIAAVIGIGVLLITHWNLVKQVAGDVWNGISNVFSNVWNGIKSIIKDGVNFIIDALNNFIRGIDNMKVPSWVPEVGGKGINIPTIPRLATGGVVSQSTLAMIGEQGKEAIVPLENNTEWMGKLADMINSKGGSKPYNLVVQIGAKKIYDGFIDYSKQKSLAANSNILNL